MITITLSTDNAAFDGAAGAETARILRKLADSIEDSDDLTGLEVSLRDLNGNKIGEAKEG